ncbi:MAG: tetratricopeptide repeat protein [Lachnospiraceae bacterium]|nr:tetratricopeptide repeat protein [Lachnospiraceae bacterium]
MRCYNCGAHLTEQDFCTSCGAQVKQYKMLVMASNRLYNVGLEKARVRDLSGAIVSLRECLRLNKNHIEARNLLGLVYFETGEVTAALSEWVISKNFKPNKNIADTYINMVQENQSRLEEINKTIRSYNQALMHCQQEGKDMAIIQLKKVLKLNPNFLRARQLLALLFMDAGNYDIAERELKKCLKIDNGNMLTKRYLQEVDNMLRPAELAGQDAPVKKEEGAEVIRYYNEKNDLVIKPAQVKEPKATSSVLNVLLGIIIGVAVTFFLVLPARIQAVRQETNEELIAVNEEAADKAAQLDELNVQVADLSQKNKELSAQLEQYAGTDGNLELAEKLLTAAQMYLATPDEEGLRTIGSNLHDIETGADISTLSDSFQNLFRTLMAVAGPQISDLYYNEGYTAYQDGDFQKAVDAYTQAVYFDATDEEALYQLGNAYRRNEDAENALKIYQQVIDLFPNTDRATRSQQYINQLN